MLPGLEPIGLFGVLWVVAGLGFLWLLELPRALQHHWGRAWLVTMALWALAMLATLYWVFILHRSLGAS